MRVFTKSMSLSVLFFSLFVLGGCFGDQVIINNELGSNGTNHYAPSAGLTFQEYAKSLPASKLNVGFDIDDTLLFSSGGTHFVDMQIKRCMDDNSSKYKDINTTFYECHTAVTNYYEKSSGKNSKCLEPSDQSSSSYYSCLDDFSIPKNTAKQLLDLHIKRGDTIYIITARQGENNTTSLPTEDQKAVAKSLRLAFDLNNSDLNGTSIHFADSPRYKHIQMKNDKLDYYYGDADTDMSESLMTKAKPVRILRSPNSLANTAANPGRYGEIVILNSQF